MCRTNGSGSTGATAALLCGAAGAHMAADQSPAQANPRPQPGAQITMFAPGPEVA